MLIETEIIIIIIKKNKITLRICAKANYKISQGYNGYDAVFFWWEEIIKVPIVVSKKRLVKNNNYNLLAMMQSYI